jgi:coenzyme F420-reducing hydrogenase delta subunit
MHALEMGFDGVFIAADGHECSFSARCTEHTNSIIVASQKLMKEKNINPKRIRMAALCSVCAEQFVNHMDNFSRILSELGTINDEVYKPVEA